MGLDRIAPPFLNRITLFERFRDLKQFAFLAMACCTVPQSCYPWLFLLKIASWLEPMLLQAKQAFRSGHSSVPAPVSLRIQWNWRPLDCFGHIIDLYFRAALKARDMLCS